MTARNSICNTFLYLYVLWISFFTIGVPHAAKQRLHGAFVVCFRTLTILEKNNLQPVKNHRELQKNTMYFSKTGNLFPQLIRKHGFHIPRLIPNNSASFKYILPNL